MSRCSRCSAPNCTACHTTPHPPEAYADCTACHDVAHSGGFECTACHTSVHGLTLVPPDGILPGSEDCAACHDVAHAAATECAVCHQGIHEGSSADETAQSTRDHPSDLTVLPDDQTPTADQLVGAAMGGLEAECPSCRSFEDKFLAWIIGLGGLTIFGVALWDSRRMLFPGWRRAQAAEGSSEP